MEWKSAALQEYWRDTQTTYAALQAPSFLPSGQKNEWLVRVYLVKQDEWMKLAHVDATSSVQSIDGITQILAVTLKSAEHQVDSRTLAADGFHVPIPHPMYNFPGTKSGRLMRLSTGKASDMNAHAIAHLRILLQRVFIDGINRSQGAVKPEDKFLASLPTLGTFRPSALVTNDQKLGELLEGVSGFNCLGMNYSLPFSKIAFVKVATVDVLQQLVVTCGHCSYIGVDCYGDATFPLMKRCGQCSVTWYCNETCQKEDWKAKHKAMCHLAHLPSAGYFEAVINTLACKEAEKQYRDHKQATQMGSGLLDVISPGFISPTPMFQALSIRVSHAGADRVCEHCGRYVGSIMKACNRCGKGLYCDRECRKAHWSKHKKECSKS